MTRIYHKCHFCGGEVLEKRITMVLFVSGCFGFFILALYLVASRLFRLQ